LDSQRYFCASHWLHLPQRNQNRMPNPELPSQQRRPLTKAATKTSSITAEARKVSQAIVAVAERVSPSVVQVDVTSRDEPANTPKLKSTVGAIARSTGSGVIVSTDGAILTNNHVIEDALSIAVRLRDGRYLPAKFIGRDPATDLAVIRIEAEGLVPAKLADSDAVKVGEGTVAIGSPFGLGYSVTSGVVSAKGRAGLGVNDIEDYLQTDASINPGNSGGPLCDLEGRVIGINSMVVGRGSGIGFAVPINAAKRVAEQLIKTGKVERPWIGAGIQDLTRDLQIAMKLDVKGGVLVTEVADGSPGQKANLRAGDVVASAFGKPMQDSRDFVREVLLRDVGTDVPLEIIRDGKRYGTSVKLAGRAESAVPPIPLQQQGVPQPGLGFTLRDLNAETANKSGYGNKATTVVSGITPGSPADRAGLHVGDAVLEADGQADANANKVQDAAKDGTVLLRLRRDGKAFFAAVRKGS
jgi:serine protease Do